MRKDITCWVGFDVRESAAFAVARSSIERHLTAPIPVYGLLLDDLKRKGLYTRPMEYRQSAADRPILWDIISNAPCSTQHANARFLVKELAKTGWAMFTDGDILCRASIARLFEKLDENVPLYCVKHDYKPKTGIKMDGMIQTSYPKKAWSSVFIINCDHPANKALTPELINSVPGRDLHAFCWLEESQIGDLPLQWNYLVGVSPPICDPQMIHFTLGCPDMMGYENCEFADEWRDELLRWAR